ncbi:uncharacterized protein FOBCDRAFT_144747 [Fusarium oxysporum Fo47]|uniref:uncharacterized protein n=1 Tax=Fusarium oxysporum Fo47 TaxID=660027 RepID=UPI0028699DF6|nr:uncharacterized protein FOBCDRAFT_144747 [Fusarium oxysporum Fo47]QKD60128.2 hypothetical protein FOBCDRAFT_144747 [Fusarium oxysporum Fo47]
MNATKWRISKACQECRVKKIRCNGVMPCQNCRLRSLGCVYREKARNRPRKIKPRTAASEAIGSHDTFEAPSIEPSDEGSNVPLTPNVDVAVSASPAPSAFASERSINNNSIEGTRPNAPSREGVEEVGPGLDLFRDRRLFFGDLADNQRPTSVSEDYSAMLIDPETAKRLLDRYLLTYWHGLPFLGFVLTYPHGHFQSERARPNSSFLHVGTAVRTAVAAGLHKDTCMRPGETQEVVDQRRIMYWSLFFWEAWNCFVVGRPSSIPDPGQSIPVPGDHQLLVSLATLSRIMDKCAKRIYSPRHDSLLPVWNAAIEIRRELHCFAEQQLKDMKFCLVGDPSTGERGVCQAMVSTMYHHTLLLTFRPFLILRAKLKQENPSSENISAESLHTPPRWLDNACEYCLEAARNSIGFLTASCATNILCRDIKYHGFFIEGACYALAFDMLQEKTKTAHRNLPWIHSGLRCLRSMVTKAGANVGQLPTTIASIEQMVRSVFPSFELRDDVDPDVRQAQAQQPLDSTLPGSPFMPHASGIGEEPTFTFPSMPFGFDVTGQPNGASLFGVGSKELADFTAADVGWDIAFGTMNMEAFLSLDRTNAFNFAP